MERVVVRNDDVRLLMEIANMNKNLIGLNQQKDNITVALKTIDDTVKELKADRTMTLQHVIGGNLIKKIGNKTALKELVNRREEVRKGLKTIEEQINHQRDNMEGVIIKAYKRLHVYVPEDMRYEPKHNSG